MEKERETSAISQKKFNRIYSLFASKHEHSLFGTEDFLKYEIEIISHTKFYSAHMFQSWICVKSKISSHKVLHIDYSDGLTYPT